MGETEILHSSPNWGGGRVKKIHESVLCGATNYIHVNLSKIIVDT